MIQSSLYAGDIDKNERKELGEKISEIIRQTDSVLIMPICQNCYSKKISIGRIIQFRDELYRVY